MTESLCFAPNCPCSHFTAWQWWGGTQGEAGSRAHGRCCGDARSWAPMAELLAAECGCLGLFWFFFFKLKLPLHFFPLNLKESKLFFHVCIQMKMLFFLFFFLSKELVDFFWVILSNVNFFPPLRLILYIGLMPYFSVADQSYQKRGLIDKQSNFLKFNSVLSSCIKINNCMLLALPWSKNGSKIKMV